jgi:predicted DNA-binding WGR domain protein
MPVVTSSQAPAAAGELETMHGWELHVTSPQRDAYYAVLVVGAAVIVAYGRRGSKCQATVHRPGARPAALRKARVMTDEKAGEGYRLTRDYTRAEVPASTVGRAVGDDRHAATAAIRELVQAFRAASAAQGNDKEGASQ